MTEHAFRRLSLDSLISHQGDFAAGFESDLAAPISNHSIPIATQLVNRDSGIV